MEFEKKRVLVITYHWPPSGGITVLRCLKLVKYLREFGWEPIVFTAKNAYYPIIDISNEKDIPEGIEIHKIPIWEPINVFKRFSGRKKTEPLQNITSSTSSKRSWRDKLGIWIRGNFFIPDARCMWIKPSLIYLEKYVKNNTIDAIFTDGPPHTNTVIGLRLKQKYGIPWLADFQDPWTQVDYFEKLYIGENAIRKHKELEQQVFQNASKITIASDTWKTDLESIGAKNVDVFYYGYDEDDFKNYSKINSDRIIIFHGGLLGYDRNPKLLFKAIRNRINNDHDFSSKIEIRFAGEVDYTIKQEIENNGLSKITTYLGSIPRDQVLKELSKCTIALLPVNKAKNAKGRIPGKLFELIRAQKHILAFGKKDCDVFNIINKTQSGTCLTYDNWDEISEFVNSIEIKMDKKQNLSKIQEFNNYYLTQKIAKLLNEITNP